MINTDWTFPDLVEAMGHDVLELDMPQPGACGGAVRYLFRDLADVRAATAIVAE